MTHDNVYINEKVEFRIDMKYNNLMFTLGRRGRDRMVVGFTTTYAISAYHY